MDQITPDRICSALIPIGTLLGLLSGKNIHKTTAKWVEVIRPLNVPMQ